MIADAARFWARVQCGDDSLCWPWLGTRTLTGYGTIDFDGHRTTAHRIAFLLSGGVIPDGYVVMHSCDNPPCCNPAHLSAGTYAENMADMRAKGRAGYYGSPGEMHPGCKLTDIEVDIVRALYAGGGMTQQAIADRVGIRQNHVSRIVRGENRRAA